MQVTVVRPSDLGESEAAQWRALQSSSLMMSHPYLSLTYVKAWGKAIANARVTVVEENGRIEAFIPYEIGDGKIAFTLGQEQSAVDGVVSSGAPLDMRAVVKKSGLRGWRFSRAQVDQKALDPYRYRAARDWRSVSYVDLSEGHDKYLSGLSDGSKKRITRTETYRRSLQRKMGSVSFHWANPKPEYFDQLVAWKSVQYSNLSGWDPRDLSVMRELAFTDNDDCRGLIGVLFAGEETAAVTYCLEGPGVIGLWTLAYNPEFSRFSAGTIQLLDLISEAATRGIKMVDFGFDHVENTNTYKGRFRNATYDVSGGGVWASRLGGTARSLYRKAKYGD